MSVNDFATQYAIRLPDGELFKSPHNGAVWTWSEFDGALHVLRQLQEQAHAMGIAAYGGSIVHRYCTPFVGDDDNAAALIDELTAWLAQQTGGTQ